MIIKYIPYINTSNKDFNTSLLAKDYLPDMNEKFHFKSMDTVYNKLPTAIQVKKDLGLLKMQNGQSESFSTNE
jgi:hypothetical protein